MASEGVPSRRGWPQRRSDAFRGMACEGAAGDCVPTRMAAACVPRDGARRRSRRWPVQAEDAFPVMAVGCLIRARWRSGRSNHGVESGVGFAAQRLLVPAQRLAHQPRRQIDRECFLNTYTTHNRPDLAAGTASAGCAGWAAPRRRHALTCRT
jgi:hypothetical protein